METLAALMLWLSILNEGATLPPPPTDTIKQLVADLNDEEWQVRNNATKELKKQGYNALIACMEANEKANSSVEVRRRTQKILDHYFVVFSDDEELATPSIWSLPNEVRFPLDYTYNTDEYRGWCKDLKSPIDISAMYYALARDAHNAGKEQVKENEWLNPAVEQLAMRLYVKHQLYLGKSHKDVKKTLNIAVRMSKTHKNMHCHYPTEENVNREPGNVPPGPLIRAEEVPHGSEWKHRVY